tara:strand:- start:2295 stop:2414 length:120 start_codon:yes stop_codon:yes gene_type:complete
VIGVIYATAIALAVVSFALATLIIHTHKRPRRRTAAEGE